MAQAHKPVRKAVFPVAGLGTRFLPATKSVPKEMLTVVDRPVVQHVVDEAVAAGIEQLIFVTGRNKGVIEDHFDIAYELDRTLKGRTGKELQLKILAEAQPKAGNAIFTRQQEPLGLGHAVWCARHIVGDEPFALLLPDMLHVSDVPCLKQMLDAYAKTGGNMIAVAPVPESETNQYGIVGVSDAKAAVSTITSMVEKPPKGTAPSNLHISGRYILQPEIFDLLENQSKGAGGEIQLTDSMLALHKMKPDSFHAVRYDGAIYDCGAKLGFLMANLALGLSNPETGPALRDAIKKLG